MILIKIKGGALQFTMFIVVVIALLLAAFIILIQIQKRFSIQTNYVLETVGNANKGIYYVLNNDMPLSDTLYKSFNDEDFKTVKVHREYWGIFEKAISVSKIKSNTFKKVALLGASQPSTNRTALYVEDQNKPLVVVGNTKIQGLAYLPEQGIRTGNVLGHSYYGSQLVYGPTQISKELPELPKQTLNQINSIQNRIEHVEPNQFLDLNACRIHQNSFFKALQVIYSVTDINLIEVSITGHILIQSQTKITVDSSANLKDVVLVAPEIEIKSNTKGSFQAFATRNILVGKNCKLDYPSAFVLKEEMKNQSLIENSGIQKETPKVKLDNDSILKGCIVYLGETKNYQPQVFIEVNATVFGEVYCNKNLELLGSVYGSVFTSSFVANQSGSSYQNHIYNGTVIVDSLPQQYKGLFLEDSQKGIASWLY